MSCSIFTMGVASTVVMLMKSDRPKAYKYYLKALKMPTVFVTQLNNHIMELTKPKKVLRSLNE